MKMKCLLCEQENCDMAEAHIFPIGFFRNIPTKGKAHSSRSSGVKGRRLQKAIYDENIVCQKCEHEILEPLDDYAIKVLRDKKGLFEEVSHPDAQGMTLLIFDSTNKEKLTRFFASIMWRVSVSKQLELQYISIGSAYEHRIRHDLYCNAVIEYLDVFVFFLTDPMHNAFFLPYEIMIKPQDVRRDRHGVNGWMLNFPNMCVVLSLDQQRHPSRRFFRISPELTKTNMEISCSTSIHPEESKGYHYMAVEMKSNGRSLNEIASVVEKGDRFI